jgi:hypothetical protein
MTSQATNRKEGGEDHCLGEVHLRGIGGGGGTKEAPKNSGYFYFLIGKFARHFFPMKTLYEIYMYIHKCYVKKSGFCFSI